MSLPWHMINKIRKRKDGNADMYSAEAGVIQKSLRELSDGTEKDPMTKLRLLCLSRGANGIIGMGRAFRNMDDDGSKALNKEEFVKGIREMALDVTDEEIDEIFERFDEDGSGSVNMTEFLLKLRPPLSQNRLNIIGMAFDKMDLDGDDVITYEDIKNVYSVADHPKYDSGDQSKEEILTAFLNNFEGGRGNSDGKVTREEFENYYAALSASIDTDAFFDLMIRRAYKL